VGKPVEGIGKLLYKLMEREERRRNETKEKIEVKVDKLGTGCMVLES
jgi:hypothetical protein